LARRDQRARRRRDPVLGRLKKESGCAMSSVLLVEDRASVRILTMNRPEKRNALHSELSNALLDELRAADEDQSVACIVLTGAGPGFCAGADLSEFKALQDPQAGEKRAELT